MSQQKHKIIKNTAISFFDNFVSYAFPFLLFPFTIHHLGVEISGIWLLCSAVTGYFGILEQGPGPAMVKFVAETYAKGDIDNLNKYVSSTFAIYLLFGGIVSAIMFLVGFFGPSVFKLGSVPVVLFRQVFFIMGGTLLIAYPFRIYASVLRGLQEFMPLAMANIGASVVKVVFTVILLLRGYGIYALLVINLLWFIASYGINFMSLKRKYPEVKIELAAVDNVHLKDILKLGGITFFTSLCALLMFQTDRLILGSFLSVAAVTYYASCKQIYDLVRMLPALILQAIMPFASELNALNRSQEAKRLLFLSTKYSYAIFVPIGVFAMVMASRILGIWVGKEYAQYGICLQILIFHLFFNFLHQAGTQILIGMNKLKFIMVYYIVAVIANLTLSFALVKHYQMIGVAYATTIPFVCLEWYFLKKMFATLSVSAKEFFVHIVPNILPVLVVSLVTAIFLQIFFPAKKLIILFLEGVLIFIAAMAVFLFYGMNKEERGMFTRILEKLGLKKYVAVD